MPLFGVDRIGAYKDPVKVSLYDMAIVDFECFTDEDGHEYYQHWIGVGDKLYKDSSILRAGGMTEKPNKFAQSILSNIEKNRDFLKNLVSQSDYIVINLRDTSLMLCCIKGPNIFSITKNGDLIMSLQSRNNEEIKFESSYRYEQQYNNYINNILGININE